MFIVGVASCCRGVVTPFYFPIRTQTVANKRENLVLVTVFGEGIDDMKIVLSHRNVSFPSVDFSNISISFDNLVISCCRLSYYFLAGEREMVFGVVIGRLVR